MGRSGARGRLRPRVRIVVGHRNTFVSESGGNRGAGGRGLAVERRLAVEGRAHPPLAVTTIVKFRPAPGRGHLAVFGVAGVLNEPLVVSDLRRQSVVACPRHTLKLAYV